MRDDQKPEDAIEVNSVTKPKLSTHFRDRQPSAIRIAGIRHAQRTDGCQAINVAIGNVSLPMHPNLQERMRSLGEEGTPFTEGIVRYTATVGREETNLAFLNVLAASGCPTQGLFSQVTDGGSQAMELAIVGLCGPAGSEEAPLMLIDAAYTNYKAFADRLGRPTVSITRELSSEGVFSLPSFEQIEAVVQEHRPAALVVIPYDNPTGQLYDHDTMVKLARLCVEHNLWLVSDEAYRELFYTGNHVVSVWRIGEDEVPGITGRRISIETSSKVWNACGLRIGAMVTDSEDFHRQAVAENTAGLCSNHIGQWIFGALAEVSHDELQRWFTHQRDYYRKMLSNFTLETRQRIPGAIVSRPDAALYSVVDFRDLAQPGFDSLEFALWCASEGFIEIDDEPWTLLTAPMAGFYDPAPGVANPGSTQIRVAYVENPERMAWVPRLLAGLFRQFESQRTASSLSSADS